MPIVEERRAALILLLILCFALASLSNIAAVNAEEDSWATMEPMPTLRENFEVAVSNGIMLFSVTVPAIIYRRIIRKYSQQRE